MRFLLSKLRIFLFFPTPYLSQPLLIDYYDEKRSYAKKCQCLQRLAELLQGGEL